METDISAPDLSYASAEAVRRQSRLLRLLEAVAVSADEAASVEEAVRTCLDQVCLHTGLCAGYAYFPSGSQEGEPVAAGLCRVEGPFAGAHPCLEPFGLELAAGVLETGKPAWIELESPGNTRGAFAFPVLAGREVLAALVLFSPSIAEPDRELGEAMARVGAHLGRVVERLRAAAALQETTERARLVIEAAADAFVSVDASDTITGLNHAAEMTFGWPREEAIGRTVADLIIAPAHRSRYRSDLAHYLGTGREPASLVTELMAAHRDGREFPIEVAIWPVRSGSGWELNAFARDISARKRAEQELADARDASLEASRLKSEFLATMSHEIRTPMNGILGMTRLLLDTKLDTDQRECAEAVERSAEALLTIINDILDVSKIEAGRVELEALDFDLGVLVADVTELLSGSARAKSLDLTSTIDPGIPTGVRGDPVRLRQILTNLVGNAVKFTDAGGVSVRAALTGSSGDAMLVRFDVTDTGIGIPESDQANIFEIFRQADASTTRRFGGTGLGLAITKQLVGLMGGEIGVVSSPGAGSTFWFSVRLGRSVGVPSLPTPSPDQPVTGHSGGARVLVVEDNPVNQRILIKTLEREGYRVDLTSTGTAAVQAVADNRYHAVLMDCQMPEMDGFEATRLVRLVEGEQRHTPIIAITASAMVTDRDRCLAAGMDDFVSKPVSRLQLLQVISRWTAVAEEPRPVETEPAAAPGTPPEAPQAPLAVPPVDYTVLDDLRAALGHRGEEVYRELIDLFLGDAPISFGGIQAALVGREAELFARAAHRLRGSASSFGAQRLIELCTEAEELGWANDLAAAAAMVPLIQEELTGVEDALRSELSGSR